MLRALIYARYSTDRQRETSCQDQAALCHALAAREGWHVEAVHFDDGISGSTPIAARPGGSRLLADVLAGRAALVLVESLDRIARDSVDLETTIRRIEARNVRIIGVSDGYDSAAAAPARKLQRGLRGLIGEIYLDDLRAKTHRGLSGQVSRGQHAGGLAYGYRTVPTGAGHALEIEPEQAATVREIFAAYAAGASCQKIVDDLNRRRVPSPRGSTWAVGALYGSPAKGTGILNNEAYAGLYVWNRSQWIKDPETGKRKRIERPRSEWQVMPRPDLRIISPEAWAAVRRRMDAPRLEGGSRGKGARVLSLFGGLLVCGRCGGAVVAINRHSYGCATRKDRGRSVCPGVSVPRKIADARLLAEIRQDLLSPAAIAEFQVTFAALLAAHRKTAAATQAAAVARRAELKKQVENLVDALAAAGPSPAITARLAAAEAELSSRPPDVPPPIPPAAALAQYRRQLLDLGAALAASPEQARPMLVEIYGKIRLIEESGNVFAALKENPAALLIASGGMFPGLVAGAGFTTERQVFLWRKP
jgi:DNA invertase Pin-like site-specific DNA recombinase